MKKFLAVFLAVVMVAGLFVLSACGNKENNPTSTSGTDD